jgi:GT2 family glycosyltransferase
MISDQPQAQSEAGSKPPVRQGAQDLSVVILTYNTRDLALDCIDSVVRASEGIDVEVIVTDNGSIDGTLTAIRDRFPNVIIVENKENLGFSGGNNRGIEISTGRHILVLNPDTIVHKDALKLTMEYVEQHPECGMVGCRVIRPDGTVQKSWYAEWSLFQAIWEGLGLQVIMPISRIDGKLVLSKRAPNRAVCADRILGCFMWMPRKVIEKVGLFDERFFLYCEEEDICRRIRNQGLEVIYNPEPEIVHLGGQTTKDITDFSRIQSNISKVLWMKKHRGAGAVLAFRLIWSAALILRVVVRAPLATRSQYFRQVVKGEWKSIGAIWRN